MSKVQLASHSSVHRENFAKFLKKLDDSSCEIGPLVGDSPIFCVSTTNAAASILPAAVYRLVLRAALPVQRASNDCGELDPKYEPGPTSFLLTPEVLGT